MTDSTTSSPLSTVRQAYLTIEKLSARLEAAEKANREPVAIVGIGCRFPGGADSPAAFWELVMNGYDAVTEVPESRWKVDDYYDPDVETAGKMNTKFGAFVQNIDEFDPAFFGISPREAASMDPQQRLLLEVVWEALENAGQAPDRLSGSDTGVFVGIVGNDYAQMQVQNGAIGSDTYYGSGVGHSVASGRVSYVLGLRGPSVSIDTACSSSLVAVHLAVQSLRAGECTMAIAGGTNAVLAPEMTVALSKFRMLAPDGHCKTFDASADGFVRGEGAGVVILKRLSDAIGARDNIVAVIRGSAVNQDGASSGLTAPNGPSQTAVIRQAVSNAGLAPRDVTYVEAHGTGTALGDPIEIQAIGAALGEGRGADRPVWVASVKTNIGHLEAAAGVAGLIKAALCVQHGMLPPHRNFSEPSPYIPWNKLPVRIPLVPTPWHGERDRACGVSSFGFSGTNAHVVLSNGPDVPSPDAPVDSGVPERPLHVLTLSAGNETALSQLAHSVATAVTTGEALADAAFTLNTGRAALASRVAVIVGSSDSASAALAEIAAGGSPACASRGDVGSGDRPKIAFLFTGQGSQYPMMGRALYELEPSFHDTINRCDAILRPELRRPLLSVLYPANADDEALLHHTSYAQPALFAIEYALADLLESWGVRADAVVGHSVGEYVAATRAGVFSLEDGLRLISARGRLMGALPAGGAMTAVAADGETVQRMRRSSARSGVSIAAYNGPENTVISGTADTVAAMVASFTAAGVKCQALNVSHAFHSELMDPVLDEFERVAATVQFDALRGKLISNLTGGLATLDLVGNAAYWRRHMREPVQFATAMTTLASQGIRAFVEIGPHPVLVGLGQSCIPAGEYRWLPTLRRGKDDWDTILKSLADLWTHGAIVDWAALGRNHHRRKIALPTYPFQRSRHWVRPAQRQAREGPPGHPLLGRRIRSAARDVVQFESVLTTDSVPFIEDHQVAGRPILPATGFIEMALAAGFALFGDGYTVEDVVIREPLVFSGPAPRVVQSVARVESDSASIAISSAGDVASPDEWRLHAEARLVALEERTFRPPSLDDIATRCVAVVSAEQHYAGLAERGLDFGPSLRGVVELRRMNGEALGEIVLPELLAGEAGRYRIHPALLDACLQTLSAAIPDGVPGKHAYLPFSIERITLYRQAGRRVWSHVVLETIANAQSPVLKATISVFDEDGVIAIVDGISLRQLATGDGANERLEDSLYEIAWQPAPIAQATIDSPGFQPGGAWLIFADAAGVGDAMAARLTAAGQNPRLVRRRASEVAPGDVLIDDTQADDYQSLFRDHGHGLRGIIHLWALDTGASTDSELGDPMDEQRILLDPVLSIIHNLGAMAFAADALPRLWIVTRGAQPVGTDADVNPSAATLWGLGRTIALEHPELRPTRIDLDPEIVPVEQVESLFDSIASSESEDQIAMRSGVTRVARMARMRVQQGEVQPPGRRLEKSATGMFENMTIRDVERIQPRQGEVEVRITAAGLNFRDVMNAMAMREDPEPLGGECAGRVVTVGDGVEGIMVGDEVVATGIGAFGTYMTTDARFVQRLPKQIGAAQGATLPFAFMTAHYALNTLGRLAPGERILIHAGAGGVGMAAIQLAMHVGAEVFATAGSKQKRDYLRSIGVSHVFDSRTLEFSEQILALTNGAGVDMVLNSLAGEFITASVSVLAERGCFLEIGKRDIWPEARFHAVKPNAHCFAIDLAEMKYADPDRFTALFAEIVDMARLDLIKPLPVRAFPLERSADAFRFMAQARHIGKVVLTNSAPEQASFDAVAADATYLITGGLTGLGLATAVRLVERGARHVVLVGRRAPSAAAETVLSEMRGRGAQVLVRNVDMADSAQIGDLLDEIDATMPKLRGIIHAAGVLADGALLRQDWASFAGPLAPKIVGAWALHVLTRRRRLDFFIMYSSVASMLGSAGQGNHASANAFLDALAHHRRAHGQPALSINWGAWSEIGVAAERKVDKRVATQGMGVIDPVNGLNTLELLMHGEAPQVAVFPVNWPVFLSSYHGGVPTRFTDFAGAELKSSTRRQPRARPRQSAPELMEALQAATPTRRLELLHEFVRRNVAGVLGVSDDGTIDPNRPLNELGLDSLMAVELRNKLGAELRLSRNLPATVAFDHPTVVALTTHLGVNVLKLAIGKENVAPAVADVDTVGTIAELTDEQIDELFAKKTRGV